MEILDELQSKGKSLKDLLDSLYLTQHAAEIQPNPKGHRTLHILSYKHKCKDLSGQISLFK